MKCRDLENGMFFYFKCLNGLKPVYVLSGFIERLKI